METFNPIFLLGYSLDKYEGPQERNTEIELLRVFKTNRSLKITVFAHHFQYLLFFFAKDSSTGIYNLKSKWYTNANTSFFVILKAIKILQSCTGRF